MTQDPREAGPPAGVPRGTLVERLADHLSPPPNAQSSFGQNAMPRRRASDKRAGAPLGISADVHAISAARVEQFALAMPDGVPSPQAEAFRAAKRPLLRHAFADTADTKSPSPRAILVTSAHRGEGKTHCALNLALSMAADTALEVLLVDADSQKGDVADRLGLPMMPGLMDGLVQGVAPEQFVRRTSIDNLFVLPRGRDALNAAELLGSAAMAGFINRMLNGAPNRLLLFDTTTLLVMATAPALGALCGQHVAVVRADSTSEEDLATALDMLAANDRIKLLLNRVTFRTSQPQPSGSDRERGQS